MNDLLDSTTTRKTKWEKHSHTWQIGGVDQLFKKKIGFAKHSHIRVSDGEKYKWQVRFYATGLDEDCKGFVSVELVFLQGKSDLPVFFKGAIAILNASKESIRFKSFPARYDSIYTSRKFIDKEMIKSCLQLSDAIYIYSEVRLQISEEEDIKFEKPVGGSKLGLDFKTLLCGSEYSDVKIVCSDLKKISAHKVVLAARSPVFSAMLKHDMLENKSGQITIMDCNSKTVELLICFIYSGKVNMPNFETAVELLNQAEKYQLPDLKLLCVDYLADNLKTSNVGKIFALCHKSISEELLTPALNFVAYNFHSLSSAEIQELSAKIPSSLLNDLFTKLSQRLQKCKCHSQ